MKTETVQKNTFLPKHVHNVARLRFKYALGWSLITVLRLIYIDQIEARRSHFFNFIEILRFIVSYIRKLVDLLLGYTYFQSSLS